MPRAPAMLTLALLGCSSSIVAGDGGAPPTGVDVIGSWHDCHLSVTFAPDGSARATEHRTGCERDGTWSVDGEWLTTEYGAGTCGEPSGPTRRRVLRTDDGLIIVDPETGATGHFANDATPHGLWILEDGALSTTASVVGDPETTFGSGCYWSTDGACGGLFSCSGTVRVWLNDGERFSMATGCSGGCPCGSVVEGGVSPDGSVFGDYRGVNCERSFEGTLTGAPRD